MNDTNKSEVVLKLKSIPGVRLGGHEKGFLGIDRVETSGSVDEHSVLENEPKKYTYDEVLECMRQACTLSRMSSKFPKDHELENLIPRK